MKKVVLHGIEIFLPAPGERFDWRDPDMPAILGTLDDDPAFVSPEIKQQHHKETLESSGPEFDYCNDPSYNWRKPKGTSR